MWWPAQSRPRTWQRDPCTQFPGPADFINAELESWSRRPSFRCCSQRLVGDQFHSLEDVSKQFMAPARCDRRAPLPRPGTAEAAWGGSSHLAMGLPAIPVAQCHRDATHERCMNHVSRS
jgi:hypothetical protein